MKPRKGRAALLRCAKETARIESTRAPARNGPRRKQAAKGAGRGVQRLQPGGRVFPDWTEHRSAGLTDAQIAAANKRMLAIRACRTGPRKEPGRSACAAHG